MNSLKHQNHKNENPDTKNPCSNWSINSSLYSRDGNKNGSRY